MTIDIWSDVICPFCYIGKRRLEQALQQFEGRDSVTIRWHSYQLNPGARPDPAQSTYEHLANMKGWSLEASRQAHDQIADMARQDGLVYNFDQSIPANTLNALRLAHMAATGGNGQDAHERLFAAYFTEGKNIDDPETLVSLGAELGLEAAAVRQMLESDAWLKEVQQDMDAARQIGIRGVPFFVFNQQYAVSGAQPAAAFLSALQQSQQTATDATNSCTDDGCAI
jgi:predicted DsbA family dithiol-disulfide isomerase